MKAIILNGTHHIGGKCYVKGDVVELADTDPRLKNKSRFQLVEAAPAKPAVVPTVATATETAIPDAKEPEAAPEAADDAKEPETSAPVVKPAKPVVERRQRKGSK